MGLAIAYCQAASRTTNNDDAETFDCAIVAGRYVSGEIPRFTAAKTEITATAKAARKNANIKDYEVVQTMLLVAALQAVTAELGDIGTGKAEPPFTATVCKPPEPEIAICFTHTSWGTSV